ncbi:DUF3189 family protein [Sporolituus thermophilus]|uniref:DUF3189 family protein n=1 Tax=Sporolituus thermophilus TaxID=608505 RepID=UPI00248209E7|nr:DUF3189 family protein [Sporolituus thermophilus]
MYYCFAGAHASVVASAIHCGLLPTDRIPSHEEFLAIPYYDRTLPELIGQPYLMGEDARGNSVYFMGLCNQRQQIDNMIRTILTVVGIHDGKYILQDAFPLITFSTKLGGLLSKRYCLTNLGRSMSIWGIQRCYPQFVELVENVKRRLE